MAMSDKRVLAAVEEGRIVIDPFRYESLGTSSYDVCLGEYFYREQPPTGDSVFNIYDQDQVAQIWGKPQRAPLCRELSSDSRKLAGIGPDDRIIMLSPGETILAHTEEFIGGRVDVTTMMKARSSLGRSFILVCKCAGWGDVGYINRWTMEITNCSTRYYIPLVVGERIAQIVFFETGEILDKDYSESGSYQTTPSLDRLKATWSPTSMLPKTKRTQR